MDRVFIRGLELEPVIGVYEWERRIRQRLELDLELGTDIRPAAASDDLAGTLDYAAIAARLRQFAADSRFQLVETLAEGMAGLLMREFGVRWLRLRLSKPGAVPEANSVGVEIERGEPF